MNKISENEKIAIVASIISTVENNYHYSETDTYFFCCEVARRYLLKMKYEGPYCLFKNEFEVNGCFLDFDSVQRLQSSANEQVVLMAIKEGDSKVKEIINFDCKESTICAEDYFVSKAVNKIIEWHNKGYKVVNIHNHPCSISALPSMEDIKSFTKFSGAEWLECEKKYGIHLPDDFVFCDFFIVTKFDCFSFNQNKENLLNITKYLELYKNELYKTPSFSEDELYIWAPVDEMGLTPEVIFRGIQIYYLI